MKTVILDAGHGGHDSGATNGKIYEKNIALDYTLLIGNELVRHGVNAMYTRETDVFKSLSYRSNYSNNNHADIFVAIHVNSFKNSSAKGVETYHYRNTTKGGKTLARDIHNGIIKSGAYSSDRGVKGAGFYVIKKTVAPAVLVELGFIGNTTDLNIMENKKDDLVKGIVSGILKNLNIKYKEKGGAVVDKPKTEVKDKLQPSTDINDLKDWAVNWKTATDEKVTDGKRPNDTITRQEVIEMIYRKHDINGK